MSDTAKEIKVLELRRLLVELKEHRRDICIRYRMIGQMWTPNFLRVIQLSEKGVMLKDEISNRFINVPEITQFMQFEIDKAFQLFKPYFHYEVVPSEEWLYRFHRKAFISRYRVSEQAFVHSFYRFSYLLRWHKTFHVGRPRCREQ